LRQHTLLIIAAIVTAGLGTTFFAVNTSLAATPSPSGSPSASAAPSPSISPSATPDDEATEVSYKPVGKPIRVNVRPGLKKKDGNTAIDSLTKKSGGWGTSCSGWNSKTVDHRRLDGQFAAWKSIDTKSGASLYEGSNSSGYMISTTFTMTDDATSTWQRLYVQNRKTPGLRIFYRVSDEGGTTDPKDADWVKLATPGKGNSKGCKENWQQSTYTIDKDAKYFQYKIEFANATVQLGRVFVQAQPLEEIAVTPSPTTSSTVSPTASTSATPSAGTGDNGKITIVTKKLVLASPTASPSTGGPLLPDLTPSPTKTTPSPKTSATGVPGGGNVNPLCYDDQETEIAPEVPLTIEQKSGGDTMIEDITTDEDGRWTGLDGEVDDFKAGTYSIKFGEYEKDDLKLVGFCVTPDDGQYYLKTQTNPTTGRATIIVRANKETKITALYSKRTKPYISMSKFALDANNKVVRMVYPGTRFTYSVRYENTGGAQAQNLIIRDAIPEQYYVPLEQTLDTQDGITIGTDSQGRTVITKTIGNLDPGKKGSFSIPVILRSNAFGTPDEIAQFLNGLGNNNNLNQATSSPAAKASTSALDSTNNSSDLELD
jgi:uncharacterized repeat protein (TIGR01451 family)